MKKSNSLGYFLLRKLEQIKEADLGSEERAEKLFKLLSFLFDEISRRENIHLTSLFTKIAYMGNRFEISKLLLYNLHAFRKAIEKSSENTKFADSDINRYYDTLYLTICSLFKIVPDSNVKHQYFKSYKFSEKSNTTKYVPYLHVFANAISKEEKTIRAVNSIEPFEEVIILWDQIQENDIYSPAIEYLIQNQVLPIPMAIHLNKVNDKGQYIPGIFVIEPSYLIDVTSIANCFQPYGSESKGAIIKRYMTIQANAAIMRGNISNFFIDELIHNPGLDFNDIKDKIFSLNPIAFSLFDDKTVSNLIHEVKEHFSRIKKTIELEFSTNGLSKENIYIEPAFYSPKYGIQGRLDLLHFSDADTKASIVELKGTKPYRPNKYGLNNSHYNQTLLYDLLIHSAYGNKMRVNNFVLYSGVDEGNLKYAPKIVHQQKEAIKVRNELYIHQLRLENLTRDKELFANITSKLIANLKGYSKQDVIYFEKVYQSLDEIERSYFNLFTSFIAREQRLSKIGSNGVSRMNGLANIWLNHISEKIEAFSILNHLELIKNESEDDLPILRFRKSSKTALITNFRVGDISVIYPELNSTNHSAISGQVLKGTILELNDQDVLLRLRSRQHNHSIFKKNKYWHIEHDRLDNGFNAMYRSLFQFAESTQQNRDLWLGRSSPGQYKKLDIPIIDDLTTEQQGLFDEMVSAKDYYLLWGPPGTGKTSFIVKYLVKYLYEETDEQILLVAYTNRAVDEICEAICHISKSYKERYIRIGSRYATNPKYANRLLVNITDKLKSRRQLVKVLKNTRIVVGTVASIIGKTELFILKKFDRIIIDEASQLLEPVIIGLLSRFKKALLIGDHKQLPAVVQQNKDDTNVQDDVLNEIGLKDMSSSLFERLYKLCESNNWDWAYGQLNAQGRMHEEVMAFPNKNFYESSLRTIKSINRLHTSLIQNDASEFSKELSANRLIYIPVNPSESDLNFKTNTNEAKVIAILCRAFIKLNDDKRTIGIITPYRAQIAKIKSELVQQSINMESIIIDTVERFQGGARDIIIISLCLNHPMQLNTLAQIDNDGVDRKLNVALTRAKEQIVIIGNQSILEQNTLYKKLIHSYQTVEVQI